MRPRRSDFGRSTGGEDKTEHGARGLPFNYIQLPAYVAGWNTQLMRDRFWVAVTRKSRFLYIESRGAANPGLKARQNVGGEEVVEPGHLVRELDSIVARQTTCFDEERKHLETPQDVDTVLAADLP